MRRTLDGLYAVSLWLSAFCLAAIAFLVAVQLGGRILDALLKLAGQPAAGFVILSLSEICGYLLAAGSFLGFAGALKSGAHIRVTMLLAAVPESLRRWFEAFAAFVAALFSGYIAWHIGRLAYDSFRFNELSPGLIPVPLGWPQAAMAIGAVILTIAFLDEFGIVLVRGRPSFRQVEDAITLGKEG